MAYQRETAWVRYWTDKKDVALLSTIHNLQIIIEHGNLQKILKLLNDYYNSMSGVDIIDQHLTTSSSRSEGRYIIIKCFYTFSIRQYDIFYMERKKLKLKNSFPILFCFFCCPSGASSPLSGTIFFSYSRQIFWQIWQLNSIFTL